jgi:hypothetical protein
MTIRTSCSVAALLLLAAGLPTTAAASDAAGATKVAMPSYTPPLRGAPASRVGGGTRSAGAAHLVLEAIAPDHTGLTGAAQPTLYWYASEPVSAPLEFTLIAADAEKPSLERALPPVRSAGIQAIPLDTLGATLKAGTEYQWFVSVVSDAAQRSRDVTAGGTIRRFDVGAAVRSEVAKADPRSAPLVYAQAGYFYDAVDGLSRLIVKNPEDPGLRAQRAALLEQVGLGDVAALDRTGAAR